VKQTGFLRFRLVEEAEGHRDHRGHQIGRRPMLPMTPMPSGLTRGGGEWHVQKIKAARVRPCLNCDIARARERRRDRLPRSFDGTKPKDHRDHRGHQLSSLFRNSKGRPVPPMTPMPSLVRGRFSAPSSARPFVTPSRGGGRRHAQKSKASRFRPATLTRRLRTVGPRGKSG
jgi:hypothetical protein